MPSLSDIRQQYPQYNDLSDGQFADKFYQKFYSDMPRDKFNQSIGLQSAPTTTAPAAPQVDVGTDVAKSVGSGLVSGTTALAGIPGDIQSYGAKNNPLPAWSHFGEIPFPSTGGIQNFFGFKPYQPQTTAGRYASTAASFVPAAVGVGLTGGLSAVPEAAAAGVASGLASEAGGDIASQLGEGWRPYGQIGGAILGGGIPSLTRRAVTPFPAPPARTAAVGALQHEGVTDLTAGQRTGNAPLRYAESEIGGHRIATTMTNQGEQFTHAVLSRAGIDAPRATPDVIDGALTRIGNNFDQLGARNTLVADQQLRQDVPAAANIYFDNVNTPNRAPIVTNYLTEIGHAVGTNNGTIPGDVYQSLRSRIAASARNTSDADVQQALNGMREALDAGMERSIAASNPNDLGAWRDARTQYRNMLVIQRAASSAGTPAAEGLITPAQLRTADVAVNGRRAFARGNTPFDELSRAGTTVMAPLPNSGTAARGTARAVMGAPALIGAALAAKSTGAGLDLPTILATVGGGTAGAATSAAIRGLLFSPAGRAYLANQILPGASRFPLPAQAAAAAINTTQPYRLPQRPLPPLLGYGGALPAITP